VVERAGAIVDARTTLLWIPFGLVGLGFTIAPLYLLIAEGNVPWPSAVVSRLLKKSRM
jgi:hypothetical protein